MNLYKEFHKFRIVVQPFGYEDQQWYDNGFLPAMDAAAAALSSPSEFVPVPSEKSRFDGVRVHE